MRRAVVVSALTLAALPPAVASADEDFYRGRQIALILSADVGGGYASYARAFTPFFAKHIPGNPNIVIQHMPGAGGIRAMNYLYSVAPKDGTVLGLVHSSVPFAPLYGIKGAKFVRAGSTGSAVSTPTPPFASPGTARASRRSRTHSNRNSPSAARAWVRRWKPCRRCSTNCSGRRCGSSPVIRAATKSIWRWNAARWTAVAAAWLCGGTAARPPGCPGGEVGGCS